MNQEELEKALREAIRLLEGYPAMNCHPSNNCWRECSDCWLESIEDFTQTYRKNGHPDLQTRFSSGYKAGVNDAFTLLNERRDERVMMLVRKQDRLDRGIKD